MKFLPFLMICVMLTGYNFESSINEELVPIDAVLLLDVSLSMRTADPERMSRDAMNLFINMLREGYDRVGVIAYAGLVEDSRDIMPIMGQDTRDYLHNVINTLEYASWTDHGLGLMEAVRMIEYAQVYYRQPIIIFFTDGNLNVSTTGTRTNAIAHEDVLAAISFSREMGIPIFSVGLNFDGNLDTPYISFISEETGGLVFETADAQDLPEIMRLIFASLPYTLPAMEAYEPDEYEIEEAIMYEETHEDAEIEEDIDESPALEPADVVYEAYADLPDYTNSEGNEAEQIEGHLFFILVIATGLIMFVLIALFILKYLRAKKRVFTGQVTIDITDTESKKTKSLGYINLIEYGRRTTLFDLLGGDYPIALLGVILSPCPSSPSHLPKLFIKNKNQNVKISKDFMPQNFSKGMSVITGTEITAEAETTIVKLRYMD